jgi:hypothetical protein
MQMKKQPPAQLETLDDLLHQAEHYAEASMLARGVVPLSLMVLGREGLLVHATDRCETDHQKTYFATVATVAAVAYEASAVAVIAESWISGLDAWVSGPDPRGGSNVSNTVSPSEAPDRKEAVVIYGQSRNATTTRVLSFDRDALGEFTAFGPSILPDIDGGLEGYFSRLMPARETNKDDSLAAFRLLQSAGIEVHRPGIAPQMN